VHKFETKSRTQVAGNLPLPPAVKNALLSVEVANTYRPPAYAGMAKPLLRDLFTSEFVHGDDGMGNMGLPDTVLDTVDAYTYVETISETTYGQVIMDTMHLLRRNPNATICRSLDGRRFKERLFRARI
jgi:inosine-uridine nucleoside N-ribohydrolase